MTTMIDLEKKVCRYVLTDFPSSNPFRRHLSLQYRYDQVVWLFCDDSGLLQLATISPLRLSWEKDCMTPFTGAGINRRQTKSNSLESRAIPMLLNQ